MIPCLIFIIFVTFKVIFTAEIKEIFRSILRIYVNGHLFHKIVDVNANVIENDLYIVNIKG